MTDTLKPSDVLARLSAPQKRAVLRAGVGHDCSYTMRVAITTCDALATKGVFSRDSSRPGAFYSPQTAITYKLTKLGEEIYRILDAENQNV